MGEIFIRQITADDLMLFYTLGNDIEACRSSGSVPATNILIAAKQLDKALKLKNSFAVVLKETGKAIGIIYASKDIHRLNDRAYMLSYRLDRNYWGKGYMPHAVKLIMEYMFGNNLRDIISVAHFTDNMQSKRVIEKCGFKYEGTIRREFTHWDGRILDSCIYSLLKDEYNEIVK